MNIDDIFSAFKKLSESKEDLNSYQVMKFDENLPHRIGCTPNGQPMFFIECADNDRTSDIKLEMFKVQFNRKCLITDIEDNQTVERTYSIIYLNSDKQDLQKYFLQVVTLILMRLPQMPSTSVLKQEISKIIALFTAPPKFSKEVIRGLWAELFVIEEGRDPEYLIKAWHVEAEDKYDFNDSECKVEVKSTTGSIRSHVFALEQLNPNKGSRLLIASVFVNQIGVGLSIFDLMETICSKITDTEAAIKLKELIYKTVGPHVDESAKLYFDYQLAHDTYRLYDYVDVPSISISNVPATVTGVHFKSDLTEVTSAEDKGYSFDSKLFESL